MRTQQPRLTTSLQLRLKRPTRKIVQELEREIGQISLGEAGQVKRQLHDFLITLVTQLLEAEDQVEKADTTSAEATAAVLSSVLARRDETILEASTRATIAALVGFGALPSAAPGRGGFLPAIRVAADLPPPPPPPRPT